MVWTLIKYIFLFIYYRLCPNQFHNFEDFWVHSASNLCLWHVCVTISSNCFSKINCLWLRCLKNYKIAKTNWAWSISLHSISARQYSMSNLCAIEDRTFRYTNSIRRKIIQTEWYLLRFFMKFIGKACIQLNRNERVSSSKNIFTYKKPIISIEIFVHPYHWYAPLVRISIRSWL